MPSGASKTAGLSPGSLVLIGKQKTEAVNIRVIDYDAQHHRDSIIGTCQECEAFRDSPQTTWIDVVGLHEPQVIESIGRMFRLHPLVQESILNTEQRPKAEVFDDHIYIVLKMISVDHQNDSLDIEQVSLVVTGNCVISFQEKPGDVFDSIRERLRTGKGRLRTSGADYLAYRLVDSIVDNYFVVMEWLGEKTESLEDKVLDNPHEGVLHEAYVLKREVILMRKAVWPLRELIGSLQRSETDLIQESTQMYLRDVYDHTIQMLDTVETMRDIMSGMMDIYLSSISNRMNAIMKVLTIIATIFIPLTFVAGVYGMNFEPMWPKDEPWGYAASLVVMAIMAGVMLVFFRRKRWL